MATGAQAWTLWKLTKTAGGASWNDSTSFQAVGTVTSWRDIETGQGALYSDFRTPNESLKEQESFFIFKQGIEPRWEDPANLKGGRAVYIDELNRGGANSAN